MNFADYVKSLARAPEQMLERLKADPSLVMQVYACIGMCGELGEIVDVVKKNLGYGKPHDREHVREELGDLFHYFTMFLIAVGFTREEVEAANIAKLNKRFPNGFTEADAIARKDKICADIKE